MSIIKINLLYIDKEIQLYYDKEQIYVPFRECVKQVGNKDKYSICTRNKKNNNEIIKEIDKNELFETVCKIKKIDYTDIIGNLIIRIQDSKIEDKMIYIYKQETWDEEGMYVIKEEDVLNVEDELLWSREEAISFFRDDIENEWELEELWIETTDEEKEVIKIAKECGRSEIRVEMM